MALEIPYDDVHQLQISLRKEAGLSRYDPNDPSLPDFPSFQDAISELDPSPSYLRCKHCKARLLRGINSIICVFCGRQVSNKDVPPEPIKFMSTFGCRWFLQSLDLDGSELVDLSVRDYELQKGQNSQHHELPLSDLLDLEIRWPDESEKLETSVSEKASAANITTLNFSGVDLDNFFTEGVSESVTASSEQQSAVSKHDDAMGGSAFEGSGNLSLFENAQPSDTVGTSKPDEKSDSFSGWEAEFQSAGSGVQHPESTLSDPFVEPASVDLSMHMESVFGPPKDLFDRKTKEDSSSASNVDDWVKGDTWSNPNTGVTVESYNIPLNDKDGGKMGDANDSSSNIDWFQDNQWPTSTIGQATDNKATYEGDDSFDAWNDFTSTTNVKVPSKDSSDKDINQTMPSIDQSSEVNFFSGSNNSKDVDFSSFQQPNFFSGTLNNQNCFSEVDTQQPEASISDRADARNDSDGSTRPKVDEAELLISQMHDLSFMLESNLSVPQKKDPQMTDPFGSFSKD